MANAGERYLAGPNTERYDQALRLLERNRDDREVRRNVARIDGAARDALSGEPVAHYTYRLLCGHLIVVWLQPLPSTTLWTYCEKCEKETQVVEDVSE